MHDIDRQQVEEFFGYIFVDSRFSAKQINAVADEIDRQKEPVALFEKGPARMRPERSQPDVWQQIHYRVPFRLSKGFSIMNGGEI